MQLPHHSRGFRFQKADAVQLAIADMEPGKADQLADRSDDAAGWVRTSRNLKRAGDAHAVVAIVEMPDRHRVPDRLGREKGGAAHTERLEKALPHRLLERQSERDFDGPAG